jgi:tRNA dimethylallyltransferase
MEKKFCLVIAGPTAVGKTALAVDCARHFNTHVLSADSRQCYREMDIGVARPSMAEQKGIPHHFIADHSIATPVTAADFEREGLGLSRNVFRASDLLVVAGGTGLYLRAFLEGMDEIPEVPDTVRSQVRGLFERSGLPGLLAGFPTDDAFLQGHELGNPNRVMRALEVRLATGHSIRHYQRGRSVERGFKPILVGLDLPREELYARIDHRVDLMMERGQLEEARGLLSHRENTALQTVGYRELFEYFDGQYTLEKAVGRIKQHTRQYAKRQLTWFRRMEGMRWFRPDEGAEVIRYAEEEMGLRT